MIATQERFEADKRRAKVHAARLRLRPEPLYSDDIATEGAFAALLARLPFLGDFKRPGEWLRCSINVYCPDLLEGYTLEGFRLVLIALSTRLPFDSYTFGLAWEYPPCKDDNVRGGLALYKIPRNWGRYQIDRRGE